MADALLDKTASDGDVTTGLAAPPRTHNDAGEHESRTRLLELSVGFVEDLHRNDVRPGKGPEGFCADFQICLPYRGLFVWHVSDDDIVGDPNQVIFVRGGESYRVSGPIRQGYAELIITPDLEVLSEIAHVNGPLFQHPLFRRRSWRADPHLQSFGARFLHWARGASGRGEDLEAEELVLALVRSALQQDGRREKPNGATTARLVRRTKEFLVANLTSRVLLADIARTVGASPAYLTDLFSRVEGVALHRYLTQLRLGRALVELPHAIDLTALALDLGFSSHSHFSFAFRRTFGCTPTEFRGTTRRAARPNPLSGRLGSVPGRMARASRSPSATSPRAPRDRSH